MSFPPFPPSSLHRSLTLPVYFSTGKSTQAMYTLSKCSAAEFTPAASLFLVFFLRSGYLMLFTSSYTYPHFLPQDLGPDWLLVFIPLFSVHTSPCLMALSQLSPPHCFGLSVPSIALLAVSVRLLSHSWAWPGFLSIFRSNPVCWREWLSVHVSQCLASRGSIHNIS